jgi:hypothetical protein
MKIQIVLVAFLLTLPTAFAAFSHQREITVSATSASSSGLSYFLSVNGSTFDYSPIQNQGRDVRFYDSDNSTLLKSWLFSYDPTSLNGPNATNRSGWFIEIPSVPAAGKTIFMKYGDANVTTVDHTCHDFDQSNFRCDTGEASQPNIMPWMYYSRDGSGIGVFTREPGDYMSFQGRFHTTTSDFARMITTPNPSGLDYEVGALHRLTSAATNWGGLVLGSKNATYFGSLGLIGQSIHEVGFDASFQKRWLNSGAADTGAVLFQPDSNFSIWHHLNGTAIDISTDIRWKAYRDGQPTQSTNMSSDLDTEPKFPGVSASTMTIHGNSTRDGQIVEFDNFYIRSISDSGDRILILGNATNISPTPEGAGPVISGRSWRENAELHWTDAGLTDIVDFFLYRGLSVESFAQYQIIPGSTQSYDDPLNPSQCFWYAVQAANNTVLTEIGNAIRLCYEPTPPPLFGDSGVVWGSQVDENGNLIGGRHALAAASGFNYVSIGILWGFILTITLTLVGLGIGAKAGFQTYGTIVGAVAGVALSTIFDFFPAWIVAGIGVTSVSIYMLFQRRRRR